MTIIAYKDGIMASNSAGWSGELITNHHAKKIYTAPDGTLVGCVGEVPQINTFVEWVLAGMKGKPPRSKAVDAIMVKPDGEVWKYTGQGQSLYRYRARYYVIGCGWEFALGAMAHGASAPEAVKLAIKFSSFLGGAVQTLRLHPLSKTGKK